MLNKIIAVVRFYCLKIFTSGIYVLARKPFYISGSAIIKTEDKGTITIEGRMRMESGSEIIGKGNITIGKNLVINKYSRIIAHNNIKLGDNVLIARFVSILDHDHAYAIEEGGLRMNGYETAPVIIGNNVWLGDKVSIMKGVTIGDNVIIGANSVVTRDIPSGCIAAGVPARVIKNIQ